VFSHELAITCDVQKGNFYIDAVGHVYGSPVVHKVKTTREIVMEILSHTGKAHRITSVTHSSLLPDVTTLLSKYIRATRLFENSVLNPRTYLGRYRLMCEFELFIEDGDL
jgi:hypothetical protein